MSSDSLVCCEITSWSCESCESCAGSLRWRGRSTDTDSNRLWTSSTISSPMWWTRPSLSWPKRRGTGKDHYVHRSTGHHRSSLSQFAVTALGDPQIPSDTSMFRQSLQLLQLHGEHEMIIRWDFGRFAMIPWGFHQSPARCCEAGPLLPAVTEQSIYLSSLMPHYFAVTYDCRLWMIDCRWLKYRSIS